MAWSTPKDPRQLVYYCRGGLGSWIPGVAMTACAAELHIGHLVDGATRPKARQATPDGVTMLLFNHRRSQPDALPTPPPIANSVLSFSLPTLSLPSLLDLSSFRSHPPPALVAKEAHAQVFLLSMKLVRRGTIDTEASPRVPPQHVAPHAISHTPSRQCLLLYPNVCTPNLYLNTDTPNYFLRAGHTRRTRFSNVTACTLPLL